MSELVPSPLVEPERQTGDAADAGATVSAGTLIRQAREAAGLHIAALAVALKVPVKKLEALEADRFDLLPDAVFVRALAASVCRTLKIDTSLVLLHLPKTSHPRLTYQGAGINAPFRAPSGMQGPSILAHLSRPAVLAGLVLLLGALVLILLPTLKTSLKGLGGEASSGLTPVPAKAAVAAQTPDAVKPASSARDLSLPTGTTSSAPSFIADVSSSPPPVAPMSSAALAAAVILPIVSPAPVVPVPPIVASNAMPSQTAGTLVFTAKGESWVEVTDSKGVVVLRRTLSAGDVAGASGAMPLTAIVGRADSTLVQVRGKAFDLAAFAKDNVARFEVK